MEYDFSIEQNKFREELSNILNSEVVKNMLKDIHTNGDEWDARSVYRYLGERNLLAPNWSSEYGGLDKSFVEVGILAEELAKNNVPEALYILSILISGNLIAMEGNEIQKKKYLPSLASGEKYATVLYSEPKSGSDLGALETYAIQEDEGDYLLYGKKVYSMKTELADYGVCAARTTKSKSKYEGITVFMVPLDREGITINVIPSLSDESLIEVVFDGVNIKADEMIGKRDDGWTIINRALSIERTGLDYYIRASRWLNLAWTHLLDSESTSSSLVELSKLECKLDCSRYLTYQVIEQIDSGNGVDEALAAVSKWYASELASEVAWKAHTLFGINLNIVGENQLGGLSSAYREGPGLTLSAGTSEMMLENISNSN